MNRGSDLVPALGGAFAFGYSFLALILAAQVQPALRAELGLDVDAIARVHGLTFLAAAIGGFFAGRLLDRGRRDAAFVLGALTTAAGLAISAAARDGVAFAAGRWLTGLGVGGGWGVAQAAVAAAVAPARRYFAAGVVQSAAPLGNVAALALAALLDRGYSWRGVLAAGAGLGLVGLALPAAFRGRAVPAPRPLSAGAPAEDDPADRKAARRASVVLWASLALHMGAFWLFYAWIPEWLERDRGLPRAFVREVQLALCAGFLVGDLVFPSAARRVGLRRAFVGASAAFAAGVAAAPASVALAAESGAGFFALAATGVAAGLWSAFGPFYAEHVPAATRGRTASSAYQLARAGQLLMQPAAPFLRGLGGFAALFYAAAACSLLGGLVALLLPASRSSARS